MTVQIPYGWFDRALHRVAFSSLDAQIALNDLELRMFRGRLDRGADLRPVFVTSLPRAGTTVMLELLHGLPEFASATYRHMPFALCPLLWRTLSARLQRASRPRERAHQDGLEVGFDSPEAFEEIVWMVFWSAHYGDVIEPWDEGEDNPEFNVFMRDYMAKVVAATGAPARRYLSKNNANIARIGLLSRLFPDCTIVVLLRNPWAQAASLHRQHQRFLEIHADQPFARSYMGWLGHFEFGALLKPIDFNGWTTTAADATRGAEFWLSYWAAAVDSVLAVPSDRVALIDYDGLCRAPASQLAALGTTLGVVDPGALIAAGARLRPAAKPPRLDVGAALAARVESLYDAARQRCIGADVAARTACGQS